MIALNETDNPAQAGEHPPGNEAPLTATATGRLSTARPNLPVPSNTGGEDAEPDLEVKFDPKALLAEQDAEVEMHLGRLAAQHNQDSTDDDGSILEADEDWYEQVLDSQKVGSNAQKQKALEDAKGEGWVPPEVLQERAVRATKRSRWQVIGVVMLLVASVLLVASIILATGGVA